MGTRSADNASESLHRDEQRFRKIFDEGPLGMALATPDRTLVQVNATFCAMLGYTEEELIGVRADDITHPDDLSVGADLQDRLVRGYIQRVQIEKRYLRKDGTAVPVMLSVSVLRSASGEPEHLLGMIEDITERKNAEQALHESRQKLSLAIDAAQAGTALWNLQTCELQWNARTFQIMGHAPDAFVPTYQRWRSQVHPDDIADVEARFHACVQEHRDFTHEHRIIRPNGEIRWVRLMARVSYGPEGQATFSTAVATDITEAKEAETQLRHAKEVAEAASHAKDQFLAVLSHELRTPLTPVTTAAQILEVDPSLSPEQQELVAMIRRNAELEARLIDDLLDLTRIARGKLALQLSTVDVHERIRHVIEMVEGDASAKQLQLTVLATAQHHHVQADAARLQQVLWNLIRNAVKFTPAGGSITIRTQDAAQGRLRVEVEDSGIGIEPSLQPRLFDAFEQGGQNVTRQFGGLGLGLAISKGLVDLHGSTLTAHSEGRGRGARFVLELAVSAAPQATQRQHAVMRTGMASSTGRRLLLVEHHADTARLVARVLRGYGHEVVVADCMAAGLYAATVQKFDLLISDLGLPDGSGLDLMRQLRSMGNLKGIAVSGFGMEEDVRKSHEAGFIAHLTKPVDLHALEHTIRDALA